MTRRSVTVTIDERTVQVPKGTGMVETAAGRRDRDPRLLLRAAPRRAGRRVPHVPRRGRGDAEAPGRLHADRAGRDGRAAPRAPREQAAEGQNATLEFILVNHPLDCPVCDKGGECPLQDLTFRYGPGNTRMTFPKRTFEKPIPISPLIALDRERCILCYRCTRFSEDGRRGRPARRDQPRRAVGDRDVRGRAVPRPLLRQRHRALPRRRAHLDAVPLRGAPVGDPERPDRLRPLPGRLQHHARRRARARSSASSRATTPRSTRAGCATRAASRTATSTRATASRTPLAQGRPAPLRGALVGRRARRAPSELLRARRRRRR